MPFKCNYLHRYGAGRTLVVMPLHSWWFARGGGAVEVRLDDLFDTGGEWRSVQPGKDNLEVLRDYRGACVVGNVLVSRHADRGVCGFTKFAVGGGAR
jgi:hypothetical protein